MALGSGRPVPVPVDVFLVPMYWPRTISDLPFQREVPLLHVRVFHINIETGDGNRSRPVEARREGRWELPERHTILQPIGEVFGSSPGS
jgi:hypothetical protein